VMELGWYSSVATYGIGIRSAAAMTRSTPMGISSGRRERRGDNNETRSSTSIKSRSQVQGVCDDGWLLHCVKNSVSRGRERSGHETSSSSRSRIVQGFPIIHSTIYLFIMGLMMNNFTSSTHKQRQRKRHRQVLIFGLGLGYE
jgi:hypothetical protein